MSLSLKIISDYNDSFAASLTTEASYIVEGTHIVINENAHSFVDLRARWNTIMRGLIVSEQVLRSVEEEV